MNYNKSYFYKCDNYEYEIKNDDMNDFNFIFEKINNNSRQIEIQANYSSDFDFMAKKSNNNSYRIEIKNDKNNTIIIQNKLEELFLKLKFLNSNKEILGIDINDYINDINDINNYLIDGNKIIDISDINNMYKNTYSNNIFNLIDKIISKLDRKIISKGQIKRKNNLIDFEF